MSWEGKHEVFIQGDGFSAFVTGVPDKCEHDSMGGTVFETQSGRIISPTTFKEWAGYTSEMRDPLICARMSEEGDPIVGGCVSCSKCRKAYSPNMWDF